MQAAIFNGRKQPLEVADIQLGSPGPREIIVRTSFAGICHSDLHFVDGLYPLPAPAVLGHESAGIVEEVGKQVEYVKPGDHVVTYRVSVF